MENKPSTGKKYMVWATPNPNGGWRQYKTKKERKDRNRRMKEIDTQTKEEALQRAKEIAKKHKEMLSKNPLFKLLQHSKTIWCGRDPFPPRYDR